MSGQVERRSVHRTQWAAQFAVASELCKRGYEVAFTMGNHPSVDIMAHSPSGVAFGIDVKGLYRKNFWVIQPKAIKDRLFYVMAFVPDEGQNAFFIMSQQQVNDAIAIGIEAARQRALAKGKSGDKAVLFPGVSWPIAEKHQDWSILPG